MGHISKINVSSHGQVTVTVPRAVANMMHWKRGSEVEWVFDKGDLILRRV